MGDGEYRKEFEELAANLGVQEQCIFYGHCPREQVQEIMSEVDFLVSASIMESFGCSIAEAQMLGIPVLATRCGGPESIVSPQTGILVDSNNEDALYRGMLQMTETYMNYDAKLIKSYAERKFSLDTISKQYYVIYKTVVKK